MRPVLASEWLPLLVRHRDAHPPVVTCSDAAVARGIPLDHELKSMVLVSGKRLVVAHTVATRRLSFEKVAELVDGSVKLAGSRALARLGLAAGRVNPFMDCLQGVPHLVSRETFHRPFLTTNDGTFTGFVRFAPSILLGLSQVILGDIDEAP